MQLYLHVNTNHPNSHLGPTHKTLKVYLTGDPISGYNVEFTPTEVGDHAGLSH